MTNLVLKKLAQEIKDMGGSCEIPEDRVDLQDFADSLACSDGFGYGLFDGGYITPTDIFEDNEGLKELLAAVKLVGDFKSIWENISTET